MAPIKPLVTTMKRFIYLMPAFILLAFSVLAFSPGQSGKKVAYFTIESPFCSGCVAGIKAVVGDFDGVEAVAVDVENHTILVTFDAEKTSSDALLASLKKDLAFKVSLKEVKDAPGR